MPSTGVVIATHVARHQLVTGHMRRRYARPNRQISYSLSMITSELACLSVPLRTLLVLISAVTSVALQTGRDRLVATTNCVTH
jgi:hypothetical protein